MPIIRPDLATLIDRAAADIEARLPGADARLRRSNLNVLARVHAGAVHGLYGHLEWIARQILPDTADADILDRHASIWLSEGRIAAAYAVGQATVTGTTGTVIAAGTRYKRADGDEYEVEVETTVVAGAATLDLIAIDAGQDGNADAATTLSLVTPIAGLNAVATATAGGLTGGADAETDTSLRARLLARIQQAPHGGSAADYVTWAKEVSGVTRAWVYPMELGAGTVTVRFVRDDDASPIPDAAEVATVQAYLDLLAPVTAAVTVVAPVAVPIAFQIALTPDTTAVRAAVEAALRDVVLREAEPGATTLRTHLQEAISLAAGESDHDLVAPAGNVAHATGEMATFGSIVWL